MAVNLVQQTVLLVNGPNLNRLGLRQPEIYGQTTLSEIEQRVKQRLAVANLHLEAFQSNSEGALIDYLQACGHDAFGIILNPGALAHYGYALRDCIADLACPVVEVHISNVHARESFRQNLVLSPVVKGQIAGLGVHGYELAADYLVGLAR